MADLTLSELFACDACGRPQSIAGEPTLLTLNGPRASVQLCLCARCYRLPAAKNPTLADALRYVGVPESEWALPIHDPDWMEDLP